MTQSNPPEVDGLDQALARAAEIPPGVPDGLMARVLDDALAEMPTPARGSLWRQVLGALGGWPAAAGLAATACVGLWVGGVMSEEFIVTLGIFEGASLDVGSDFGAFDLLLVDG